MHLLERLVLIYDLNATFILFLGGRLANTGEGAVECHDRRSCRMPVHRLRSNIFAITPRRRYGGHDSPSVNILMTALN